MKRPLGFTLLSLFLLSLSFAAVGNLFVGQKTLDMKILIVAYGLTAFAAALGLWRFKEWAYRAFLSWSVVVLLLNLDLQYGAAGMFHFPMIAFIPWTVLVLLLLYLPARYIRNRIDRQAVVK